MDGAVWIAGVSGIPPFIIGATVVSLATTLPEIIVSLMAAAAGQLDMATGNAIGSVTANTALILAFSVLCRPCAVDRRRILPKALIFIGAILLMWLVTLSGRLRPFGSLALILLFTVYIIENLHSARRELGARDRGEPAPEAAAVLRHLLLFFLGAAGIIIGSRLLVDYGTVIARDVLHIDERVVALTLVAVGTSLPELVTAVSAVLKRESSLAVGNIIGANIVDMLLILPLCSLVSGTALPIERDTLFLDLPFSLMAAAVTLLPMLVSGRFRRWQGAAALGLYAAYLVFLFV